MGGVRADKRETRPAQIVCMDVLTLGEPSPGDPQESVHSFKAGFIISARWEHGQWTREKKFAANSGERCLELLNLSQSNSRPTYLFSQQLMTLATICGFWGLLESGEWSLSATHLQQPRLLLRGGRKDQKRRVENGLVLDGSNAQAMVLWNKHRQKIVATSLSNYYATPGHVIARALSLPWPDQPHRESDDEQWFAAAEQRCEVIYQAIIKYIDWWYANGLGTFALTTPGNAMSVYRNRCAEVKITPPEDAECRDFERAAYYGGITECNWVGKVWPGGFKPPPTMLSKNELFHGAPMGQLYMIDASSFYGSMHATTVVPTKLIHYGTSMSVDHARELIVDDSWLATVHIQTDKERFPIRTDDRVIYSTGRYTTTLCGPELLRAIQTESVVGIGRWHHYRCEFALEHYARVMWNLRKQAEASNDCLIASVCKHMLAALHGKFAQRKVEWEVDGESPCLEPWGRWDCFSHSENRLIQYRAIGQQVQRTTDGGDCSHTFPAIAAWTTANGRECLRAYERIAGRYNTLYLSTDSLIVTEQGKINLERSGLIQPGEIGGLRIKCQGDTIEMRGCGNYEFAGRIWMSGVRRNPADLIFGTVSSEQHSGLSTVLASHGGNQIHVRTYEVSPGWWYDAERCSEYGWLHVPYLYEDTQSWLLKITNNPTYSQSLALANYTSYQGDEE